MNDKSAATWKEACCGYLTFWTTKRNRKNFMVSFWFIPAYLHSPNMSSWGGAYLSIRTTLRFTFSDVNCSKY